MKKLLLILALVCLYAIPAKAQLVIVSDPFGNVQAPVDQGGWHDFKLTLIRNVTFTFVGVPPPSQSQVTVTFIQDATGARVVTFGGNIVSPGCLINGTPGSTTFCFFHFDSTTNLWTWIPTSGSASQLHGNGPPANPCTNGFIYTDDTTGNTYSCKVSTWVSLSLTSGSGAPTNPCALNSGYTDTTTGNFYSCNAGTWLFVGPVTTTTGPSCSTDTFTATPTYTFTGADQCHIMTLTGNVTSITIAGTPANHTQLFLKFPEDGMGGRTFQAAFPGTFVFPTGFTPHTAANNQNNMAWVFDGTLWRPTVDFGGGGSGGSPPGGFANDTQCNNGASAFSACANRSEILYVTPQGNDANSGKTWDTAKLTIMAAVCALPNGGNCSASPKLAGGGTIYFTTGVSCNSNPNAGCWIAGNGDSQFPNMTGSTGGPTAWTVENFGGAGVPLNFVCATMDTIISTGNRPSCTVIGPSHTVGNVPLLWVSGNSLGNFYINGMTDQDGVNWAAEWGRIGIDSATGNIVGTPTVTQTVSFTIENSSSNLTGGAQTAGWGPQLALGNGFWMHLINDDFGANNGESCQVTSISRTSNVATVTTNGCQSGGATSCPFLVGDHLSIQGTGAAGDNFNGTFTATSACSGGSTVTFNQTGPNFSGSVGTAGIISDDRAFGVVAYSPQVEMSRMHFNGGGMKFYTGPSATLQLNGAHQEGGGTLTLPILWTSSLAFGAGGQAEVSNLFLADTPLIPSVINDAGMLMFVHNEQSQSTAIRGPMVLVQGNDSFNRPGSFIGAGQSGWYNNTKLEADIDIARREAPISTSTFTNLATQNPTLWSGANTSVVLGKRDPFGGTGATEVDGTAAGTSLFYNVTQTVNIGDTWYFGAWARAVNTNFVGGSPISFGLTTGGFGAGDTCIGGSGQVFTFTPWFGDGNWFWVTGACTIYTNPSQAGVGFGATVDATHAVQIYRPYLFKVAAGSGISPNEIALELNSYSFGASTAANPGDISFPSDKHLCMPSGSLFDEFCGYFTHANTVNRTYTLPDFSGTVCVTTSCPSFGNPDSLYDNFNRSLLNTGGPCPNGSCYVTSNIYATSLFSITGNQIAIVATQATVDGVLNYPTSNFGPYEFGMATITGSAGANEFYGIELNVSPGGSYICEANNGLANLWRIQKNGVTQASGTFALATGDILYCETVPVPTGTQINAKRCIGGAFPCTTEVSFTDTSPVPAGQVGAFLQTFSGGITASMDNFFAGTRNPSFAALDIQQVFTVFQQFPGLVVGALPTPAFSPAFGQLQTNTVTATTSLSTGATPPNCTAGGGTAGTDCLAEGTATTNTAGTQLLWANAASHELGLFTNGSTTLSGVMVRDMPTPVLQTGQTAAIATSSLCASSPSACSVAGQYHVHINMWGSGTACATPGPGGASFTLTWTDEAGVSHAAVVVPLLSQTSATAMALQSSAPTFPFQTALANESASGDLTISSNGSIIQYATSYTACTTGTGTYNLRASVTHLVSP